VKDDSLWVSFMGSDFVEEGRRAGNWLVEKTKDAPGDVNIVELQGTTGSAPAIDRKKGLRGDHQGQAEVQDHQIADRRIHRAPRAKRSWRPSSKAEGKRFNVLFAHNDDMAIGAIQASRKPA